MSTWNRLTNNAIFLPHTSLLYTSQHFSYSRKEIIDDYTGYCRKKIRASYDGYIDASVVREEYVAIIFCVWLVSKRRGSCWELHVLCFTIHRAVFQLRNMHSIYFLNNASVFIYFNHCNTGPFLK